jgi:hypothetical protein
VAASHLRGNGLVSPEVEDRATRLGAALFIFGLVTEPASAAREATWALIYPDELAALAEATRDDYFLTNGCLELEAELRQREWAALERLLGLVAAGEGTVPERIERLPDRAFRPAARAALPTRLAQVALGRARSNAKNVVRPARAERASLGARRAWPRPCR